MSRRKLDTIQHKELYKEVFGTEAGKLVLNDICTRFGMMRNSNPEDSNDKMRFMEGQRNVCLFILAQVDADLNKMREMRETYKMEILNV